jgi:hypothetical protein
MIVRDMERKRAYDRVRMARRLGSVGQIPHVTHDPSFSCEGCWLGNQRLGGAAMRSEANARISRRRMLKRIGAGAAIAWSAPIITSLDTPAFAASPVTCATPCTDCFGCSSANCGGTPGCSLGSCLCSQDVEGNCFCAVNAFTDELNCTISDDCTAPRRCMVTESGGCTIRICLDPCGTPLTTRSTRSGTPAQPA